MQILPVISFISLLAVWALGLFELLNLRAAGLGIFQTVAEASVRMRVLGFFIVVVSLMYFISIMGFPGHPDEMAYHLSDAEMFLQQNSLTPPDYYNAYMPDSMTSFYAALGRFFPRFLAKSGHFMCWLSLVIGGFTWLSKPISRLIWVAGCLASPLILQEARFGLVDVASGLIFVAILICARQILLAETEAETTRCAYLWVALIQCVISLKAFGIYWAAATFPVVLRKIKDINIPRVLFAGAMASLIFLGPWFIRNWTLFGTPLFPFLNKGSIFSREFNCLSNFYLTQSSVNGHLLEGLSNYYVRLFAWPAANDSARTFTPVFLVLGLWCLAIAIRSLSKGLRKALIDPSFFLVFGCLIAGMLIFYTVSYDRFFIPLYFGMLYATLSALDGWLGNHKLSRSQIGFIASFSILAVSFSVLVDLPDSLPPALEFFKKGTSFEDFFLRATWPQIDEFSEIEKTIDGKKLFRVQGYQHYFYHNYMAHLPNAFYDPNATPGALAQVLRDLKIEYVQFDPLYDSQPLDWGVSGCTVGFTKFQELRTSSFLRMIKQWPSGRILYQLTAFREPEAPSNTKPAAQDELVRWYQNFWNKFNTKAWNDLRESYASNAVSQQLGYGQSSSTGPDGIVKSFQDFAKTVPDAGCKPLMILAGANHVTGICLLKGTNTGPIAGPDGKELAPTNRKLGLYLGHSIEIDPGGRVVKEIGILDGTTLETQLGFLQMAVRPLEQGEVLSPLIVMAKNGEMDRKNVETERGQLAAWNKHDMAGMDMYEADDFVLHDLTAPNDQNKTQALELNKAYWKGFSGAKIDITSIWGAGDYVSVVGAFAGTNDGDFVPMKMKKTGKKVVVPLLNIFRIDGGKVKEEWVFFDSASLRSQLATK
jgi:predicted ester cyclase